MIERLLLDRIDAEARRAPVGREHHRVAHARANEACAALTLVQLAVAGAEIALHAAIVEAMPPAARIERAFNRHGNALAHRNFSTV
jgi:hypothetical protein